MLKKIICSFIASDRPGLIETVADCISKANGNWLESRSTKLAGQFAGIICIDVLEGDREQLIDSLKKLNHHEIIVQVNDQLLKESVTKVTETQNSALQLTVLGNDRPGIVLQVSQALANANINVIDMQTFITSAAMSGDSLFNAKLALCQKNDYDIEQVEIQLEMISRQLTIEIDLEKNNDG
jgi:glycine cleavage system regulatory protein